MGLETGICALRLGFGPLASRGPLGLGGQIQGLGGQNLGLRGQIQGLRGQILGLNWHISGVRGQIPGLRRPGGQRDG